MSEDSKPQRIFKPTPKTKFFAMRNQDVQRTDLSYEAIGLLAYLISLPDDWEIHTETLYRDGFAKRDKVRRMIKELVDSGYMRLVRPKDETGKFLDTYYEVYGIPEDNPDYRTPENPSDGKTVRRQNRKTAKPHLQKTYDEKGNKEEKRQTPRVREESESQNFHFQKILTRMQQHAILTTGTHLELFKSDFDDYSVELWDAAIDALLEARERAVSDPDKKPIGKPFEYVMTTVKNIFSEGLVKKEVAPMWTGNLLTRKLPTNIDSIETNETLAEKERLQREKE